MGPLSPSGLEYVRLLPQVPLERIIERIPTSDPCCPICLEQFIDAVEDLPPKVDEPGTMPGFRALPLAKYCCDGPVITPCFHIFGKSCLISALNASFRCPMCREDLRKDALRIRHEEAYIGFRPCDAIKPWHELSIHICISTVVIFPRAWKERFAEAWKAHLPECLPLAIREDIDKMWPKVSEIVYRNFEMMAFMPLGARNASKTPSQFRAFTAATVPEVLKLCLSPDEYRFLPPLLKLCIAHVFKAEALKQLVVSVQGQLAYERAASERDGAGTSGKLTQFMLSLSYPAYDLYNGIPPKKMLPSNSVVDPKAAYATCCSNTSVSCASIADYYRWEITNLYWLVRSHIRRSSDIKRRFMRTHYDESRSEYEGRSEDMQWLLAEIEGEKGAPERKIKDYTSRYQEALDHLGVRRIDEPHLGFMFEQEMRKWRWGCEDWEF